jgi:hypothetical protein
MSRTVLRRTLAGLAVSLAAPVVAEAQTAAIPVRVVPGYETAHRFFAAPGYYGTSFGTPSYGVPRTYSSFSSPYGAGYGYGYAPYGYIPGPYGAGLWQAAGAGDPLFNASSHSYRTWAVPYVRGAAAIVPPLGLYAPALGPPVIPGH